MTEQSKASAKSNNPKASDEETKEGAPQTETPESPDVAAIEDAPREDVAPLETPEAPAPPPAPVVVVDEAALADLKKEELKEEAAARDLPVSGTKAELVEKIVEQSEADFLAAREEQLERERESLHVSISPVNAHAPIWTPREPNVTGGYS